MSDSLPTPDARISDRDREDMANRLRDAYADGYLDREEFDERLERALAAKTRADLQPLAQDLPEIPGQAPMPTVRDAHWWLPFREWAGVSVLLVTIWTISSVASGELLYFWPIWPVGGWGAFVLAGVISGTRDDDEDGEQLDQVGSGEKRLDGGKD